ncbi:MAG: hypothetical protein ACI4L9_00940 [Candidatus Coproplasma sp.]
MDEHTKEENVASFKADTEAGLKEEREEKNCVTLPESEFKEYKSRLFAVSIAGVILGLAALVMSIVAFVL